MKEDIKIEQTQCSQDRPYGDFYRKYKIYTKCENLEEVLEEINQLLEKQYGKTLETIITSKQWHDEDNCASNHFRDYYSISKQDYGYLLIITSPSTH